MSSPHVLVIEDDPVAATIVQAVLTRSGATTTLLADGRSAIAYLAGEPPYHLNPFPSLVILDLGLPGVHGLTVLEWMSAGRLLRVAPVIVFSGSRDPADQERALQLGARFFLRKPADPRELAHCVAAVLADPRAAAQEGRGA